MNTLNFAVLGTGFWAGYQVPGWLELPGVKLLATCDRDLARARALADRFGAPHAYADPDELLRNHAAELHFVDVITQVETHRALVEKVVAYGLPVICQKPMADSLSDAQAMLDAALAANVPFFVHENWRWQAPVRRIKEIIDAGTIGKPFRARLQFCHAFPVFENQPALREVEHLALADVGSHLFDVARLWFGEVAQLYCRTATVNPTVRGEDVATTLLSHRSGVETVVELSFSSRFARDPFPESFYVVEGSEGSITLSYDNELAIATRQGVEKLKADPSVLYDWVNPDYALVHCSIVDCNRDILKQLRGEGQSEMAATDNFETARLVWAAYESAKTGQVVEMSKFR